MSDGASNELLPIGSVVQLDGEDIFLMVMGYYPEAQEQSYDYVGVPFPQGILEIPNLCLFNQDDVGECVFEGYQNDDGAQALHAARRIMELRAQMNMELMDAATKYLNEHEDELGLDESTQ